MRRCRPEPTRPAHPQAPFQIAEPVAEYVDLACSAPSNFVGAARQGRVPIAPAYDVDRRAAGGRWKICRHHFSAPPDAPWI
ncbi:hypothetical protein WJ63_28490 [Burkholderia pyrrocinia]|nr:hypothetical protein WJ63_28490 [Burkholderia pyrrocinia]